MKQRVTGSIPSQEKIFKWPHIYYGFLAQLFIMVTDGHIHYSKTSINQLSMFSLTKEKNFATSSMFFKCLSPLSFHNEYDTANITEFFSDGLVSLCISRSLF